MGDSEFGRPLLIENLDVWGWDYALRQPADHLIMPRGTGLWQRVDALRPRLFALLNRQGV